MSDAVRSYTHQTRMRRPRKRQWGCSGPSMLVVSVLILIVFLWVTRDKYTMESLIPANQNYHILARDMLNKRAMLAKSSIWSVVPESSELAKIPAYLQQDLGVPEWVLRNLLNGDCYLSGNTLKQFKDLVFVTKMSRIGCLLEIGHYFIPSIKKDIAGGLNLREIKDSHIWYAVRGRVLLVSQSRESLIHFLTLTAEEALPEDALEKQILASKDFDILGNVTFSPDDTGGEMLNSLVFNIGINQSVIKMQCSGQIRPEWQTQSGGLLEGIHPQALTMPVDGLAMAAVNFGIPFSEVKKRLVKMNPAWDAALQQIVAGGGAKAAALNAVDILGPGIRLCWKGLDLNEIVPAPQLVAVVDCVSPDVLALAGTFGATTELKPGDMAPYFSPEKKRFYWPTFGGPSLELTAGAYGKQILISSSRTVGDTLLDAGPKADSPIGQGNVYMRVLPKPCIQAVLDVAGLLAEYGLLKGYSLDSLKQESDKLLKNADSIEDVMFLMGLQEGTVTADFAIHCKQAAD